MLAIELHLIPTQSTLSQFRKNKHSQNGEDGVIAEICHRLAITNGFFVEFGAWDGMHLSNTYKSGSSPIIVGGVRAFRSGRVWRCGSFRRCGIPVRRT